MNRCRLCLDGCNELGGSSIKDSEFRLIISTVFSCTISEEHGLPEHVCSKCFSTVTDFYKYSNQVKANQELLKQTGSGIECVWIESALSDKVKVEPTDPNSEGNADLTMPTPCSELPTGDDIVESVYSDGIECLDLEERSGVLLSSSFDNSAACINGTAADETPWTKRLNRLIAQDRPSDDDVPIVGKLSEDIGITELSIEFIEESEMEAEAAPCIQHYATEDFNDVEAANSVEPSVQTVKTTYPEERTTHKLRQTQPYTCDLCGISFSMVAEYQKHQYGHHSRGKTNEMAVCKKAVGSIHFKAREHGELTSHKLVHPRIGGQSVTEIVAKRYLSKPGARRYHCEPCDSSYKLKQSLLNHNALKHPDDAHSSQQVCGQCNQLFWNQAMFRVHRYHHRRMNRKQECPVCHKGVSEMHFISHVLRHASDAAPRYRCKLCNKSFKFEQCLTRHNARQHASAFTAPQKKSYACDRCDKSYDNSRSLQNHRSYHKNIRDKLKECPVCGKRVSGMYFKAHLEGHSSKGPCFQCNLCYATFKRDHNLTIHIAAEHSMNASAETFACDQCNKVFSSKFRLTEHGMNHKQKTCPECGKTVALKYFTKHMDVHNPLRRRYCCEMCKLSYKYKCSLVVHNRIKHGARGEPTLRKVKSAVRKPQSRSYACEQCGRSFYTKGELTSHKLYHVWKDCPICGKSIQVKLWKRHVSGHDSNAPRFRCDLCDTSYKLKQSLATHNALKHPAEVNSPLQQPYACEQCDRSFWSQAMFRVHQYNHKRLTNKKECPVCRKTISEMHFSAHVKRHSSDAPRFRCEMCNISYKSKTSLNIHNAVNHASDVRLSEKQSHVCEQCGESFSNEILFKRHVLCHASGTARFRCEACNTSFKTKNIWHSHNRLKHARVEQAQSHPCDLCDKKFDNKVQLSLHRKRHNKKECPVCGKRISARTYKIHLTVHSTDAPRYRCELCDKSYKFRQGLRLHNIVTHPPPVKNASELQSFVCDQCGRTFASQQQLKVHQYNHKKHGRKTN